MHTDDQKIVFWTCLLNWQALFWLKGLGVKCSNIFCMEILNVIVSWSAMSFKCKFWNVFGQVNKCFPCSWYLFPLLYRVAVQQLVSILQTVSYPNKMSGLKQFFIVSGFQKWPSVSRKRVTDLACVSLQSQKRNVRIKLKKVTAKISKFCFRFFLFQSKY